MTNKASRRTGGFTLIEVMVVVVIIGIIASLAPRVLIEIERFFLMNRTRVTLQRDARASLSLITRNLRQAESMSIKIDQVTGQPVYSRITFTKQDLTGSTADNATISYYQQGRVLKMKVVKSGKTVTSDLCSNLHFLAFSLPKSNDLSIVSVSVTLEQNIFEGKLKALHLASEKVRVMN